MNKPKRRLLALVACLGPATGGAQEAKDWPELDVGWLAFGDLYHVPSHHLETGEGATGGVLRRGYLTLDAGFSPNWYGRLRFELNQSGAFETYDFEADFKDLHLGWRLGGHKLVAGLSPTLTYDVIEEHWGLRYLMRTPMDLQGVASRDTGISVRGPLADSETWAYRFMYGSGFEFGADSNDSRKWMGALNWKPAPRWMIDVYVDYEDFAGSADRHTLQGFAGYRADDWRLGIQYSHQDRESDPALELASAYLVKDLGDDSSLVGRIDRIIEPSPRGNNISYIPFDPSAPATMYVAGWEYRPGEHFRITPNAIVIRYDRNEEGLRPETDVHLRLTLFVDFE